MKIAKTIVLLGLIALSFGAGEAADFGWELPFPPQCVGNTFADVPSSMGVLCGFIEEFSKQGITAGCAADNPATPQNEAMYCPNSNVTRAQMAVFLYTVLKKVDDELKKLDGVKHYMTVDEKKPQSAGSLQGSSTPTTLRELIINPSGLTSVTPPFYVNCSVSPAVSGLTFLETMPIVLNKDANGLLGSATCSIRTSPPITANQFTVTVTIRDNNPNGLYDTRTLVYEFLAPVLTTNPTTLSSGKQGSSYSSSVTMSATVDGSSCATCTYACNPDATLTAVGISASASGSTCAISGTPSGATTGNMTFKATDTISGLASNEIKLQLRIDPPTPTYVLTVTKAGAGTGNVAANTGALSWSGNTGTATYNSGTQVTLTATADGGSTFAGWSGGACSGTGTCQVTIDQAKSVTATFTVTPPNTFTLTVTKTGTGTGNVTPTTGSLSWSGNAGTATYNSGTQVTLTATADGGSAFAGWSGEGCSGTSTCTVAMTAHKYVTASFTTSVGGIDIPMNTWVTGQVGVRQTVNYTLTLPKDMTGGVTVNLNGDTVCGDPGNPALFVSTDGFVDANAAKNYSGGNNGYFCTTLPPWDSGLSGTSQVVMVSTCPSRPLPKGKVLYVTVYGNTDVIRSCFRLNWGGS